MAAMAASRVHLPAALAGVSSLHGARSTLAQRVTVSTGPQLSWARQPVSCNEVGFRASAFFSRVLPHVSSAPRALHLAVECSSARGVNVTAKAGYKLKTHKASAKRFRVTGTGKVVCRQAGRAHLLRKKSNARKNRLAGMVGVHRTDLDNVVGALPYLKVNRRRSQMEPVEEDEDAASDEE